MTIWINSATTKRVNIYAPYAGFSRLDTPEIRERAGVIEVLEPAPPEDYNQDTYFKTESQETPYVIYTKKSDAQIQEIWWTRVKQQRDEITDNGGCLVQGKWFHTDPKSKQQQMALTMLGANIPADLQWKTMDGSFVLMTQSLAAELFQAQVSREQLIFVTAELAKNSPFQPIQWPDRYVEVV